MTEIIISLIVAILGLLGFSSLKTSRSRALKKK